MRIHILSDLHNEFQPFEPSDVEADLVVLAGDIHSKGRSAQWALETFPGSILLVAGNHEYYNSSIEKTEATLRESAAQSGGRLHYLQRDSIEINGVRFLGATAWTGYQIAEDPAHAMYEISQMLNDHRKIRLGSTYRRWSTRDAAQEAHKTRLWLEDKLAEPFPGKTVVVTHHPLSVRSLDLAQPRSVLDAAFANAWEHLFGNDLALAIHGHTHYAVDYTLNGTRIVSNPAGYPGEKTGFDPSLVVEI
jgi:predicted phosphodiesterase